MTNANKTVATATTALQNLSTFILSGLAIGVAAATAAAAAGVLPWIDLPIAIGGDVVTEAGMYAQIGVAVLLLALLGFLPANSRMRRLEVTNRNFQVSMTDVAQAYDYVHRADREGVFELSREFDAMRERIDWMRNHPELAGMEHDVLQLAAQMSVESRELAQIYADEKVER
ncbi:MAG: DNA repair protein, partial [Pseudomonadota bacterium]